MSSPPPEQPGPERRLADETPPEQPAPEQPTPEQWAERGRRADRASRAAMAGILGLEAVVTLLVPRAIAFSSHGLGTTRTILLVALAVLMILAAGVVRRRVGIGVGSVLQLLFVLTGILTPAMFVVGVVFAAIWGRLLLLRHEVVGTPGGVRMLVS